MIQIAPTNFPLLKGQKTWVNLRKTLDKDSLTCYIKHVESIQKELRDIIRKEGLTPYAVAKAIGIDHASLYKSLIEGANLEWNTIKKVLEHLGYDFKIIKRKEVKPIKSKPSRRQKGGL